MRDRERVSGGRDKIDEIDVGVRVPGLGAVAAIVQSMLVGAAVSDGTKSTGTWVFAGVLGVVAIACLGGGLLAALGADEDAARRGRRGASTLVFLIAMGILIGIFAVLVAAATGHSAYTRQPLAEVRGAATATGVLLAYALPMLIGAMFAGRARKRYLPGDGPAGDEVSSDPGARFSVVGPLRYRGVGLALLLVGLAGAGGAGWLVQAADEDGNQELRAYAAAPLCAEMPVERSDCRWRGKAIVHAFDRDSGRGRSPSLTLEYGQGRTERTEFVEFGDVGPVFDGLLFGDEVTITIWNGRITTVVADGRSQETLAAPYDHVTRTGIGALIVGPTGVLLAIAGAWRLVRPREARAMNALVIWATTLIVAGVGAPILAEVLGTEDESFSETLTAWVPIAVLCGLYAFWRAFRGDPELAGSVRRGGHIGG